VRAQRADPVDPVNYDQEIYDLLLDLSTKEERRQAFMRVYTRFAGLSAGDALALFEEELSEAQGTRGGDGLDLGWCALKSPAIARSASPSRAASALRGERFLSTNSCKLADTSTDARRWSVGGDRARD